MLEHSHVHRLDILLNIFDINSHAIQLIHLICEIQWLSAQNHAFITIINYRIFSLSWNDPLSYIHILPYLLPLGNCKSFCLCKFACVGLFLWMEPYSMWAFCDWLLSFSCGMYQYVMLYCVQVTFLQVDSVCSFIIW